jgi:hypothetical protein
LSKRDGCYFAFRANMLLRIRFFRHISISVNDSVKYNCEKCAFCGCKKIFLFIPMTPVVRFGDPARLESPI